MSNTQEALTLALEALDKANDFLFNWHENQSDNEADAYATARQLGDKAITAIREALAEQPAQEPIAWSSDVEFDDETEIIPAEQKGRLGTAGLRIPLYTFPPARKPLEGVIDVRPIGLHSLQLIFRSQRDIEKFQAAHGVKGEA